MTPLPEQKESSRVANDLGQLRHDSNRTQAEKKLAHKQNRHLIFFVSLKSWNGPFPEDQSSDGPRSQPKLNWTPIISPAESLSSYGSLKIFDVTHASHFL
jgi:hypothetical protein